MTVTFEFGGTKLAGRTVVAFESLKSDEDELAAHVGIDDEAQSSLSLFRTRPTKRR